MNPPKANEFESVSWVGPVRVALPGEVSDKLLDAVIADKMGIGVINKKTAACRLIPVPGKKEGEKVFLGGCWGRPRPFIWQSMAAR